MSSYTHKRTPTTAQSPKRNQHSNARSRVHSNPWHASVGTHNVKKTTGTDVSHLTPSRSTISKDKARSVLTDVVPNNRTIPNRFDQVRKSNADLPGEPDTFSGNLPESIEPVESQKTRQMNPMEPKKLDESPIRDPIERTAI